MNELDVDIEPGRGDSDVIIDSARSEPAVEPVIGTDELLSHVRGVLGCAMPCDPNDVATVAVNAEGCMSLIAFATELAGRRAGIPPAVSREAFYRGVSAWLVREIGGRPAGPVH